MRENLPALVAVAFGALLGPCRAQTANRPRSQAESAERCVNTPYYWQRFTLTNADDMVFKLDVLTGDAWLLTNKPEISWVRVRSSHIQPAACPRFRLVETKRDYTIRSPYEDWNAPLPKPILDTHITDVFLLDTETGDAWPYISECWIFRRSAP